MLAQCWPASSPIVIFLLPNTGRVFAFSNTATNYPDRITVKSIPRARSLYSETEYSVTHWYSRTYTWVITTPRFT